MRAAFIGADARIADLVTLAIHLRWPDITPVVVPSASAAMDLISQESLDVILLHSDIVDKPLTEFLRDVRALTNAPLLVLSDRGNETEVVTALEEGADDYIRLPCELTGIMIRIWALVRRSEQRASFQESERPLRSGTLSLDPQTYVVSIADRRLHLTTTEFRLLHFLLRNRGAVLAHQTMERALWSGRTDGSQVRKYVKRLRDKMGDDAKKPCWVATVHGVGYRFVGPPD